jgi:hypothetical protein
MNTSALIADIDKQIASLQAARIAIAAISTSSSTPAKRGPGRPRKAATVVKSVKKRFMSPEGAARIAAAQKKRWAAKKKAAKKKAAAVAS